MLEFALIAVSNVIEISMAARKAVSPLRLRLAGFVEGGMIGVYVPGSEQVNHVPASIIPFDLFRAFLGCVCGLVVHAVFSQIEAGAVGRFERRNGTIGSRTILIEVDVRSEERRVGK